MSPDVLDALIQESLQRDAIAEAQHPTAGDPLDQMIAAQILGVGVPQVEAAREILKWHATKEVSMETPLLALAMPGGPKEMPLGREAGYISGRGQKEPREATEEERRTVAFGMATYPEAFDAEDTKNGLAMLSRGETPGSRFVFSLARQYYGVADTATFGLFQKIDRSEMNRLIGRGPTQTVVWAPSMEQFTAQAAGTLASAYLVGLVAKGVGAALKPVAEQVTPRLTAAAQRAGFATLRGVEKISGAVWGTGEGAFGGLRVELAKKLVALGETRVGQVMNAGARRVLLRLLPQGIKVLEQAAIGAAAVGVAGEVTGRIEAWARDMTPEQKANFLSQRRKWMPLLGALFYGVAQVDRFIIGGQMKAEIGRGFTEVRQRTLQEMNETRNLGNAAYEKGDIAAAKAFHDTSRTLQARIDTLAAMQNLQETLIDREIAGVLLGRPTGKPGVVRTAPEIAGRHAAQVVGYEAPQQALAHLAGRPELRITMRQLAPKPGSIQAIAQQMVEEAVAGMHQGMPITRMPAAGAQIVVEQLDAAAGQGVPTPAQVAQSAAAVAEGLADRVRVAVRNAPVLSRQIADKGTLPSRADMEKIGIQGTNEQERSTLIPTLLKEALEEVESAKETGERVEGGARVEAPGVAPEPEGRVRVRDHEEAGVAPEPGAQAEVAPKAEEQIEPKDEIDLRERIEPQHVPAAMVAKALPAGHAAKHEGGYVTNGNWLIRDSDAPPELVRRADAAGPGQLAGVPLETEGKKYVADAEAHATDELKVLAYVKPSWGGEPVHVLLEAGNALFRLNAYWFDYFTKKGYQIFGRDDEKGALLMKKGGEPAGVISIIKRDDELTLGQVRGVLDRIKRGVPPPEIKEEEEEEPSELKPPTTGVPVGGGGVVVPPKKPAVTPPRPTPVQKPAPRAEEKPTVKVPEGAPVPKPGKPEAAAEVTPDERLAETVRDHLERGGTWTQQAFFRAADEAYGGTRPDGTYQSSRAYDALELGVNRYIMQHPGQFNVNGSPGEAHEALRRLDELLNRLPVQAIRSGEKDLLQQFSTPPTYAYVAAWAADIRQNDVVLEPSAGTGSLAVHARNAGPAEVIVNEISKERRALLGALTPDRVFAEDAEFIDKALWGKGIPAPTVVLMNPPFSHAGTRMGTQIIHGMDRRHVEAALRMLAPGGRLVAIMGRPMIGEEDTAGFQDWLNDMAKDFTVKAHVWVPREVYSKYGTTFPTRFLVMDNTGPTKGKIEIQRVDSLDSLVDTIEGVRHERVPAAKRQRVEPGVPAPAGAPEGRVPEGLPVQPATGGVGIGEPGAPGAVGGVAGRPAGAGAGHVRLEPRGRPGEPVRRPQGKPGGRVGVPAAEDEGAAIPGREGGAPAGEPVGEPIGGVARAPSGERVAVEAKEKERVAPSGEVTDVVFVPYKPARVKIAGAKPHPGSIDESAAMAAVLPPKPTYSPTLPKEVIEEGLLSDIQLEAVVYTGQAHAQFLPEDEKGIAFRQGMILGDGGGTGKGRIIAGVILDNRLQGRHKAAWITASTALLPSAIRDWGSDGLRQDPNLIIDQTKIKAGAQIEAKEGILFTSYGTLRAGEKKEKGQTRVDQIIKWLGEDFDGVIAFDECHKMGNLVAVKKARGRSKPSEAALAGAELKKRLPNARILFPSATMATEVHNLAYADRLPLWGRGTCFANVFRFIEKIQAGGIAAMELVARDLKAMGLLLARHLSWNDGTEKGTVTFKVLETPLSTEQTENYDTLARAWQIILRNIDAALHKTDAHQNGKHTRDLWSRFWGSQQRFFNQIITGMKVPALIRDAEEQLKVGNSIGIQLVNTLEANQERALAKHLKGEDFEELDLSPRDIVTQMLMDCYPIVQYVPVPDGHGGVTYVPGETADHKPLIDPERVKERDALIAEIRKLKILDSPLDMLVNHFGPDNVAEVTGRKRRIVYRRQEDGRMKAVLEKRSPAKRLADIEDYMNRIRRIIIYSECGQTGLSYHADLARKNQEHRVGYVLQCGWRADQVLQGMWRIHRSNQASAPSYVLLTTNIKGERRFISSIARRLAQLGALTQGQREAASTGLFSPADNLESTEAKDALQQFFKDLYAHTIEDMDIESFQHTTGLHLLDSDGQLRKDLPPTTQFLNRLLALTLDQQEVVFTAFWNRVNDKVDAARVAGTLDVGVETYRAAKITKVSEQVVYQHPGTEAETKYVHLKAFHRVKAIQWEDVLRGVGLGGREPLFFARNVRSRQVYAFAEGPDRTDPRIGRIEGQYRRAGPLGHEYLYKYEVDKDYGGANWVKVDVAEAQEAWNEHIALLPKLHEQDVHLITGLILPIWDRIPGHPRVWRMVMEDGEVLLGRVIPTDLLGKTLRALGAEVRKAEMPLDEMAGKLERGEICVVLSNGWVIGPTTVQGEPRIELEGPEWDDAAALERDGVFVERVLHRTRFFIPRGAKTETVLAKITKFHPVVEVRNQGDRPDTGITRGNIVDFREEEPDTGDIGSAVLWYQGEPPAQPMVEPPLHDQAVTTSGMIEMPELVRIAEELMGGQRPKILRRIGGKASRMGRTQLRGESAKMWLAAAGWVGPIIRTGVVRGSKADAVIEKLTQDVLANTGLTADDIVVKKDRGPVVGQVRITIYRRDPQFAARVLGHEIGHVNNWLPEKTMASGNILGRIASLTKYLKETLAAAPESTEGALTPQDRAHVKRIAIRRARKELGSKDIEGIKQRVRTLYPDLLRQEIARRGLYTRGQIMEELKQLTLWWNPFNPAKSDPRYVAYRFAPPELYAEAVSVLLNNPAALEAKAPMFYKAVFAYMEAKPDFAKVYHEILAELKSGNIMRTRVQRLRSSMDKGDELRRRRHRRFLEWDAIGRGLAHLFRAQHWTVMRMARPLVRQGAISPERDPEALIEEAIYSSSEVEYYYGLMRNQVMDPLFAGGLDERDLAEYGFHLRVIKERKDIPNPEGWTPKQCTARVDEMKKQIGATRFEALERAHEAFWQVRQYVISRMREANMFSEKLMAYIEDNDVYVTFNLLKHLEDEYGKENAAKIWHQIGTLQPIEDPIAATWMKDASLLRAITWNDAKRGVVSMLLEYYPDKIQAAVQKWTPQGMRFVEPTGRDQELLVFMHQGQPQAFYVSKWVGDAFRRVDSNAMRIAAGICRGIGTPFRMVFTVLRPGFQPFNIRRDLGRAYLNAPKMRLWRAAVEWVKALPLAFHAAWGHPGEEVQDMMKHNVPISVADYGGLTSDEKSYERLQAMYFTKPSAWWQKVQHPIRTLFHTALRLGQTVEMTPKIAGWRYLTSQRPEIGTRQRAHIVRTQIGSPPFLVKGFATPITNNLVLFSNAHIQGYAYDWAALRDRPGEVMMKLGLTSCLPTILKWLLASGAMIWLLKQLGAADDDDMVKWAEAVKRLYSRVSEYDMTSYDVIPLGETPQGKTVVLRLPRDERERLVGGMLWKLLNLPEHGVETLPQVLDYTAGQMPSLNPAFEVIGASLAYLTGRNPYDSFRGRHVLPDNLFTARNMKSHLAMLKWSLNAMGAGIIYRFNTEDVEGVKTELERVLNAPILSDIIGRWVKVTDYGTTEKLTDAAKKDKRERAREIERLRDALNKQVQGKELSTDEVALLKENDAYAKKRRPVVEARRTGQTYREALLTAPTRGQRWAMQLKIQEMEGPDFDLTPLVEKDIVAMANVLSGERSKTKTPEAYEKELAEARAWFAERRIDPARLEEIYRPYLRENLKELEARARRLTRLRRRLREGVTVNAK